MCRGHTKYIKIYFHNYTSSTSSETWAEEKQCGRGGARWHVRGVMVSDVGGGERPWRWMC
jgi:hypothetical protein